MPILLKHGKSWKGRQKEMPNWVGKNIKCDGGIMGIVGCGCIFVLGIEDKRKVYSKFQSDDDKIGFIYNDYVKCPECGTDIHLGEWNTRNQQPAIFV